MATRRHTFLIADDEPDVLDSLRHLFHRDYRVLTAGSGPEALAILEREPVDILLSDQRMPGMTGDELLRAVRDRYPDVIRLLFTGYADIQAVVRAINRGGLFRYVLKPWDAEELAVIIRQAAEQHDLLAERRQLMQDLRAANDRLTEINRVLAETDALRTAFLEVASHEFNTPITVLLGMSELLDLIDPDRDEQERTIIRHLIASSRQLARLVRSTVQVLHAGDVRHPLQLAEVDLADLLADVVDQIRPFVAARGQELASDLAPLGTFLVDPDKVRDALLNVLSNAVKFTPDGGSIAVRARLADDARSAEIAVEDRGIGLDDRALAHLFQPFFTEFDASRHSSGDFGFNKRGLGLGLSLVKRFVELHGGRVSVTSALGRGTSLSVTLPRRPPSESRSADDPRPDAP